MLFSECEDPGSILVTSGELLDGRYSTGTFSASSLIFPLANNHFIIVLYSSITTP
jgi:hypothetical protein